MTRIDVAAGVIWREGRVLISRRGEAGVHGGLWEFPGGKLEPGETPLDCLKRELQEEMGIAILPDCVLEETEELLEDGRLLHFYFVQGTLPEGEPSLTEHTAFAWAAPSELKDYDFCPSDAAFAKTLSQQPVFEHFFWDFDGTLMDTYPLMSRSLQRTLESFGYVEPLEAIFQQAKVTVKHACRYYGEKYDLPVEELMKRFRQFDDEPDMSVPPFEGMVETLLALKARGAHHYLYTHRNHSALTYLATCMDPAIMEDAVTGDDPFPRKPDPTALLALLERNGIDPAKAIMVGDRNLDVEAAVNAGIAGCLLDTDGHYADYQTRYRAAGFAAFKERFI